MTDTKKLLSYGPAWDWIEARYNADDIEEGELETDDIEERAFEDGIDTAAREFEEALNDWASGVREDR